MARIRGNNGSDSLDGGSRADRIFGRAGDDILDGKAGNDKIFGAAGSDQLFGRSGRDKLFGGADDDILFGHGGKDKLKGGAGNDQLYGGKAKDKLFGEDGDDQLYGGQAKDKLFGGAGNDLLSGDGGNDKLFGGVGIDTVRFSGNRADYDVIAVAGGFQIVHARGTQLDGSDFISSDLEFVQFGDVFVNINNLLNPPGSGPGPGNDAPVAADDSGAVAEDGVLNAVSVLVNDTDADGDGLAVSAVNGVAANVGTQIQLVSGALLTLNANGSYTYDPNGQFNNLIAGQTATDSFIYTVSDGNGGTDTATVTITINGVGIGAPGNDPPVASNDAGAVSEDGVLNGASVVANDTDADGDLLTVTEVNGNAAAVGTQITLASGALLTLNADGTYTYNPNGAFDHLQAGQTGGDSFQYTVSDGHGGTDTGAVNITVNGVNDTPAVTADALADVDLGGILAAILLNVEINPEITIDDPDDDFMEGARIAITEGYRPGDDQLVFQNQNGITGSFDAATGVLTLTGHATKAQYEAALESVDFALDIGLLDLLDLGLLTGEREVTYQIDDGDGLSAPEVTARGAINITLLDI